MPGKLGEYGNDNDVFKKDPFQFIALYMCGNLTEL